MRARGAVLAALALCACTTHSSLPASPLPAGPQIRLAASPVPLDPRALARDRIGAFAYAGGLQLASPDTTRLHGLSDLRVTEEGQLAAVSDDGDLFEARLRFDGAGRLAGLTEARLSPLEGPDGRPLSLHGKAASDAEGLAVLADGTRLVSFERDHRILAYPPGGGPPRPAPAPSADFPANEGLEALAEAPEAGPDAYLAGDEAGGRLWLCRISAGCAPAGAVTLTDEAGLVAVAALPGGARAYLLRAFSPLKGVRVVLRIAGADGAVLDELRLAGGLTVDNYEGLAAVPQADGRIRFYLLSDDNFSSLQRTLLVAFDWTPPQGRKP